MKKDLKAENRKNALSKYRFNANVNARVTYLVSRLSGKTLTARSGALGPVVAHSNNKRVASESRHNFDERGFVNPLPDEFWLGQE
jgi:hypothetical protein